MSLPVTVVALDLREIFLLFLDDGIIDTCCRRVMSTTLSLSTPLVPRTSLLVVLVLLGRRSLLSGRRLFSTRRISRRGVGGHIFSSRVFFFLPGRPVSLETPWVHVVNTEGGLQQRLCLCIDAFLNGLFPGVLIPTLSVQLGLDGRPQAFPVVPDHGLFVQSGTGIKLSEDRLQVLQVGCPVKDFF